MNKYLCAFLILLLSPALAAENVPLEITADKGLEWNQNAKTYTARGNAMAQQGEMSVKADTLVATYAGANNSNSDIINLTADGHVVLVSGTDTATGDKATYDLTTGKAVLSGGRPKITQQNKNSLEADVITVWTVNNVLDHAEATGNVVIANGVQTATGNKATYNTKTAIADLSGNVKITQDRNILEGDRAEINLVTKISKMTAQGGAERIKGVFYTGKKEEK